MQAYFETVAVVPVDHHLDLHLPAEIPPGPVRIAVIYQSKTANIGNLDTFLATLPINAQGHSHADILRQVQEERESWGNLE